LQSRVWLSTHTAPLVFQRPLTQQEQQLLDRMIRVDHAGELGAHRIYQGQYAILKHTSSGPVIKEMWEQEQHHLRVFEELIHSCRARPTFLKPFWDITGVGLGVLTALLGKEAAMACTEAVETVIGDHYNDQLRQLIEIDVDGEFKQLRQVR
jgi:ubiquinone biosynthesis monooxygenase Coq7